MPAMVRLKCDVCETEFERKQSVIDVSTRRGQTKHYCSKRCSDAAHVKDRVTISCAKCGKEIQRRNKDTKRSRSGRQFCSRSCAIAFNNSPELSGFAAKKKRKYGVDQTCVVCGSTYTNKRRLTKCCPDCIKLGLHHSVAILTSRERGHLPEQGYSPLGGGLKKRDLTPYADHPISSLFGPPGPSKFRAIRIHAVQVAKDRPKVCESTGYDKHVETAHIRHIGEFDPSTPLRVVNDPRNLVNLSPNAHWELDHDMLSIDDLNCGSDFRNFEREATEAGYLK